MNTATLERRTERAALERIDAHNHAFPVEVQASHGSPTNEPDGLDAFINMLNGLGNMTVLGICRC